MSTAKTLDAVDKSVDNRSTLLRGDVLLLLNGPYYSISRSHLGDTYEATAWWVTSSHRGCKLLGGVDAK